LCEALFSLDVLRQGRDEMLYGRWRRMTQARLSSGSGLSTELRWLLGSPVGGSRMWTSPAAGVLVRHVLASHIGPTANGHISDRPRLAHRDVKELVGTDSMTQRLDTALATYWRAGLKPYWGAIQAHVRADTDHRGRIMLTGGVTEMLATLHPTVDWQPPVMHIANRLDHDLCLNQRGLVLQPSVFCWPTPIIIDQPDMPAVLVYRVNRCPDWDQQVQQIPSQVDSLAALLGRTRAAILAATTTGRSTTEIARTVGVSLPTASQHTSILRSAGLITTRRHGGAVIHQTSPLGTALVNCSPPLTTARVGTDRGECKVDGVSR
jgi:DNA-binding transcriptional ArsR family regulator